MSAMFLTACNQNSDKCTKECGKGCRHESVQECNHECSQAGNHECTHQCDKACNGNHCMNECKNQEENAVKTMTQMSENFIFGEQTAWHDAGGGVVRQILGYDDDIMMVKVQFKKGQKGDMHQHPHSQCTFVASGVFEFTIGETTKIVKAGDALFKQPNLIHGCTCLEDGVLIDCFSPMRDTFLEK